MSTILGVLQQDLKNATIKEITDCMKKVNDELKIKLIFSGKKDEIIQRFSTFIVGLVSNERHGDIAIVVRIINETAPRKLNWKYEESQIKVNCQKKRVPVTNLIDSMNFVRSPFIKPIFRLTNVKICPVTGQYRQTKAFNFILNDANRQLLATPNTCDDRPPYQIRFYCARYQGGKTENLLVEFPAICELKVNDSTIPGHTLRCIKGKPGTVNPPDVSIMIKKQAQNNIELVYVHSTIQYIASAYIVERTPVQTLIEQMKKTKVLTKEKVLEKLQRQHEDQDVIMESETVSTKCPLAFTRIHTPIRSKQCAHLQCYDAFTFLTMNEQTPTWACPVCHRRIDFWEDLIVDEYFTEMLQRTPKHINSVRIEPNGVGIIEDEDPERAAAEEEEEEEELLQPVKKEEVMILLDDDDDSDDDENDIITKTDVPLPLPLLLQQQQQMATAPMVPVNLPNCHISQINNIPITTINNIATSTSPLPQPASANTNTIAKALTPPIENDSLEPPMKRQRTSNVIDLTLSSDEEEEDEDVQMSSSSSTAATTSTNNTYSTLLPLPPLQEVSSLTSQSSQNESLILPHTGTLYNNNGTSSHP